ncbi:hypothetical protein C9I86_16090 [Photobacterium sp. NCIMB 13483]|uniref:Arabidopsis retrotransposon Orf1 C-terminal domain-containing protein n=1 Tax=Photobacterium piscicola TaxID=1378299 RepID=A0ABU6LLC9_9GAMM|nr:MULTISPECIES: hypothetical protein [Photobacterium]MEC6883735.1 hypothetical protein [Photobacterium piscicola]MEC6899906.1 hypothetical protein [Photobacterium piscicola]PST86025.1 hypothetical protein C9I86_16090 [Photobacterium sp. NCIMB 13483]
MVKSLCKYRRAEIADQFATITKIVSEPTFICASCTRVASDKNYLCKPSRLTNTVSATAATLTPMPTPAPMMTLAASTAPTSDTINVHQLPMPTAVGQSRIEMVTIVEQAEVLEQPDRLLEQTEKLKKLAKKKNKLLKKAAKAVKKFDKQLRKTKQTLGLTS